VAAIIAEEAFDYLKAPIVRVAAPDVSSSFPPGTEQLVVTVHRLLKGEGKLLLRRATSEWYGCEDPRPMHLDQRIMAEREEKR